MIVIIMIAVKFILFSFCVSTMLVIKDEYLKNEPLSLIRYMYITL